MEALPTYENYLLIGLSLYLFLILITYLLARRLDKTGIRTKAIINAIEVEEYDTGGPDEASTGSSYRLKANISFETDQTGSMQLKIPLAKRYTADRYKSQLPIIYPPNNPLKAKIDDMLYIYTWPLALLLIGLVGLFVAMCFTVFAT